MNIRIGSPSTGHQGSTHAYLAYQCGVIRLAVTKYRVLIS